MSRRTASLDDQQVQQGNLVGQMNSEQAGRVWRACLECRKKKSKCDGKDICKPCQSRNRECVYPPSNDNASTSRQMIASFEAQCQHMESLCQRMENMMERFTGLAEFLEMFRQHTAIQAFSANVSEQANDALQAGRNNAKGEGVRSDSCVFDDGIDALVEPEMAEAPDDHEGVVENEDSGEQFRGAIEKKAVDYVMTTDSYGKLRFVGGTSTMMMIEALQSLKKIKLNQIQSPVASINSDQQSPSILELPFFNRGQTFPRLPCLPRPENLIRPPRYIADLLIDLYFSKLHYTMPVLYKPHFVQRYNLLMDNTKRPDVDIDAGFLAVLFAVWACASALLPRDPGRTNTFTGFQYYENAIILNYASTGEGTIEQVQTLALLSMCSAGWNTLAHSWKLAGQAVRAAQDLGLHRSPARGAGERIKEELCRRVWWSVYDLDRVLSICLGRPMAVEDADCDCEMPLDMDDSELEDYGAGSSTLSPKPLTNRLSGFIAFSRLCQISRKVTRAVSSLQLSRMRQNNISANIGKLKKVVGDLDKELTDWLQKIPDSIKFSPNNADVDSPHMTMCVISYIVHAGCVINLHWPLLPDNSDEPASVAEHPSYQQCMNAARSCIQVAAMVQECVLPSHYLAFCTHYLALSGVFLLRNSPSPLSRSVTTDIEACIRYLENLEYVWTGARRSRSILEELFKHARSSSSNKKKRTYHQMVASKEAQGPLDMGMANWSNAGTRPSNAIQEAAVIDHNIADSGEFDVIASMDPTLGQDFFADFF